MEVHPGKKNSNRSLQVVQRKSWPAEPGVAPQTMQRRREEVSAVLMVDKGYDPVEAATEQAVEKLEFRIRVSLQRYRKFLEIRCPFRGLSTFDFFPQPVRALAPRHDTARLHR